MTAPNEYEPSAEAVEALAKELHEAGRPAYGDHHPFSCMADVWQRMMRAKARFVLRRQHAREADAKLALRYLAELGGGNSEGNIYARRALERWERLDAPKVPTLLELHAAFERHESPDTVRPLLAALVKAVVEREEKR